MKMTLDKLLDSKEFQKEVENMKYTPTELEITEEDVREYQGRNE